MQVLLCAIATGLPLGVVTISISGWSFESSFSKTIIAKTDVPAETFPVRSATLFVATMPVPASPSGGQSGIPAWSCPVGSSSLAPSSVSTPGGISGDQDLRKNVPELPGDVCCCEPFIEQLDLACIVVVDLAVDGEHAGCFAHAQDFFSG